jgi:hypothetical protein
VDEWGRTPVTLDEAANYADLISAATVMGGVIFGLIQLAEIRKQRRDMIASELMRTFYSVDLADAVTLIHMLPDHCPTAELRARGPQYERAAVSVCTSFETMGLLVHSRIADFDLVRSLCGGMVVVMWRKLDVWLDSVRAEQSQPSWAEWFQWLAQVSARHKDQSRPAHVAHRDWAP